MSKKSNNKDENTKSTDEINDIGGVVVHGITKERVFKTNPLENGSVVTGKCLLKKIDKSCLVQSKVNLCKKDNFKKK